MRYGHRAPLCKFFGAALTALSLAAAAPARADETPLTIVALGDSLTAGYLLGPDEGFPEVLERALHEAGHENVKVANAGVSGDTTTGGLARLGWALGANAGSCSIRSFSTAWPASGNSIWPTECIRPRTVFMSSWREFFPMWRT